MFQITDGKGFQITFANGYTLSVQFGTGSYCDNRSNSWYINDSESYEEAQRKAGSTGSVNAEIAAFRDDDWIKFDHDTVKGWVTPDELVEIVKQVSSLPAKEVVGSKA